MAPLSSLDPILISNIILGTIPISFPLFALLLSIEHRLTKIETKMECLGLCEPKTETGESGRS